jgi:hypothetical protein
VGQATHAPVEQTWPPGQALPQVPQLFTSLVGSTQVGLPLTGQTMSLPPGQMQPTRLHEAPTGQQSDPVVTPAIEQGARFTQEQLPF